MSLSTYAGLQTAAAAWLTRSDTADYMADWITLAEARLNRFLRVDKMLARDVADIDAEFFPVPDDFLAPYSMRLTASPFSLLEFLTPDQMSAKLAEQPSGDLQFYSLVGQEFWFAPAPTDSVQVELINYVKIAALSDTNTSNWLLTAHPDAYLRGVMLEASLFYEDAEEFAKWEGLFQQSVDAVQRANIRDKFAENLTPRLASGSFV